jgi:hypothetical protein
MIKRILLIVVSPILVIALIAALGVGFVIDAIGQVYRYIRYGRELTPWN